MVKNRRYSLRYAIKYLYLSLVFTEIRAISSNGFYVWTGKPDDFLEFLLDLLIIFNLKGLLS